ncbi:IS1634 family transposase [Thermosulfurimonas marina]|uniref:IS1634 family transposase n=1 Tax=Thermosulfurimonas marina TaxID=2047767 RepID=A0A6H1WS14_9BACT|nr:IS1634 family transposase [Thermosulfurimonas marina]QJA05971.1 IS1634 family transposase [Thermosulfurimonas marina]
MYIRTKTFKNKDGSTRTYLYIVEGKRVNGKVRQRIVANLGRLEKLQEGELDKLIEGLAKFSRRQWIEAQARSIQAQWAKDFGPALIFRRLWEDLKLSSILKELLAGTEIAIDVEEAVFAMVLNRLCDPASKLGVSRWKETVYRPEFERLKLHHFYRALDFLADHKEEIEEKLFERIRDLFHLELDLVFWDTASVYFEGRGAEGFCEYGFSKDHRPDRVQVILGFLMTREGIPIAHEVFPGATADVETFRVVLKDLQNRFRIRRVILVADRGMVSREVLKEIEAMGLEYLVGVRMRRLRAMKEVLGRGGRFREVKGNLKVKEVWHEGRRYLICFNPEEAERERLSREEMVGKLEEKLKAGGLKGLIGNRGYRRYLKVEGSSAVVDREVLEEEARYDGKYVLETNAGLSVEEAALAYRGLWQVERAFREMKSGLDLRPVYHWTEKRIRGHIMVCFLAFVLEVVLMRRLREVGYEGSYQEVMTDLERLKAVEVTVDGRNYLVRTELEGKAYEVFKAVGIRVPGRVLEVGGEDVVERGGSMPGNR